MPRIDNHKFYTSAINKYGTTSKGVHWNSQENQEIRFDLILDFLPKNISKYDVCDAGCGFADLYHYMEKKNKVAKSYIGIDSLDEMREIASSSTDQKILIRDITKEVIPRSDYYVCSGALNILTKFESFQFIQNCFQASRHGFIFNVLHGDKESNTYNYLSTDSIQKLAKTLKVKKVRLQSQYIDKDITVGFYK